MSNIHISRTHQLGLSRAKQAIDRLANDLASRHGVRFHWQDNDLHFRHQGVEGHMRVGDEQVNLQAKLGLLMKPWRGRLEKEISQNLDRTLTPE